jgi:hypothetical protein
MFNLNLCSIHLNLKKRQIIFKFIHSNHFIQTPLNLISKQMHVQYNSNKKIFNALELKFNILALSFKHN